MERLLKETPILNYNHLLIKNLIEQRKWDELSDVDKGLCCTNLSVKGFSAI